MGSAAVVVVVVATAAAAAATREGEDDARGESEVLVSGDDVAGATTGTFGEGEAAEDECFHRRLSGFVH